MYTPTSTHGTGCALRCQKQIIENDKKALITLGSILSTSTTFYNINNRKMMNEGTLDEI